MARRQHPCQGQHVPLVMQGSFGRASLSRRRKRTRHRIQYGLRFPLGAFEGSVGPSNFGDLSRDEADTTEGANFLRRSDAIVPQLQDFQGERRAKTPWICNKVLSALKCAADSVTHSTGRRQHGRAASLPRCIRARPTVADPRAWETPTHVHAWEAPVEALTASLDPTQRLSSASMSSKGSSSPSGSTHTAEDWVKGW